MKENKSAIKTQNGKKQGKRKNDDKCARMCKYLGFKKQYNI
jgi:hypothetical protein